MTFHYKEKDYEVEIIKKNNKNTYVRVVNNKISVTTNYFTSKKAIFQLLEQKKQTIGKMIEVSEKRSQTKDLFFLFGKQYDIIYDKICKKPKIEDNKIYISDEKTFNKWLSEYIHTIFLEHLTYWHQQFEEPIPNPNLKIRRMKTRWGVCNVKNHNITLNLELFRYDIKCLDYVIIHELAHFLEPNHSKNFWSVVEKYCPNYKEIKKILKD